MDFDAALETIIGGHGRWQLLLFISAGLVLLPCKMYIPIFPGYLPQYRCFISECDTQGNSTYSDHWTHFAIPEKPVKDLGSCWRYATKDGVPACSNESFDHSVVLPCQHSVYDRSMFQDPMVAFFDIGPCSNNDPNWQLGPWISKLANVEVVFWIGVMAGSTIFGWIADQFGTLVVIHLSQASFTIGACLAAKAPVYWVYVIGSFFAGFGCLGSTTASYILVSDIIEKRQRHCLAVFQIFRIVGGFAYGLMAYYLQSWRSIWTYASVLNFAVTPIWWFLHDSPRWLLSQQKYFQARKVLDFGSGLNRTTPLTDIEFESLKHSFQTQATFKEHKNSGTFQQYHILRNLIVSMIVWTSVGMIYMGLCRISVALEGDIYRNFLVVELAEFFGMIISGISAYVFGYKFILCLWLFITSLILGVTSMVTSSTFTILLIVAAKAGASVCVQVIYIFTPGLFQTRIRNTTLGLCTTFARLGALLGSWIINLQSVSNSQCLLVFASGSAIAAILLQFFLPETSGVNLPETIQDVQALDLNHNSMWSNGGRDTRRYQRLSTNLKVPSA